MISILNLDNSEEEPKKTTDYKLDDLEMVKTIGKGKTADYWCERSACARTVSVRG